MKKLKVFSISAILIVICCSFLFSASVSAASKKRNKFDHKPSGNIYYYDENGKEKFIRMTDIPFSLISNSDQELFRQGVVVKSESELDSILQDFES